ncbi:hypothetical protein NADFUDRAFT_27233 [Nadsonia fulvescens var. elongata DSM 6958]|uniref:Formamidopyrimidine-DNA glycosylase catalytic domain-containing protein n=1 Tax=Nadsonia fulvescens var. elongata DSM 6958 TaxID=857566 RepID=A0A1E3PH98_9ASCO|nr:hypothetical protein NADFUDRAFT_27233 [Nadsonia fulvescens var. elongata DSM 6958]
MPELGEIAHITSVLQQFLVGKTIDAVEASEDSIVYPGLPGDKFENTLLNRKVEAVERHGKYFWLKLSDSHDKNSDNRDNTVLIHFGMTGWIKVKGYMTHFMVMENGGTLDPIDDIMGLKKMISIDKNIAESEIWPPKWSKFVITTSENEQIAMIDPRRLARVRLFNVDSEAQLMTLDPMSRQGVDFSKPDQVEAWGGEDQFIKLMAKKVTKIKSLLLDQAVFAGIGNWMGDEILYHSHIHPLSRACDLDLLQVKTLYKYVIYICEYVVKYEANTNLFPANWLMLYRWKVGRSTKTKTKTKPKTNKRLVLDKVSVGGRTSVFAPEKQKITKLK